MPAWGWDGGTGQGEVGMRVAWDGVRCAQAKVGALQVSGANDAWGRRGRWRQSHCRAR